MASSRSKALQDLAAEAKQIGATVERLVRDSFDAGIKEGLDRARARIGRAFAEPDAPPLMSQPPHLSQAPDDGSYGEISNAVRLAMCQLNRDSGLTPGDVHRHLQKWPSTAAIEIGQVRTALKVLARRRELRRIQRGKYVASSALLNSLPSGDRAGGVVPNH